MSTTALGTTALFDTEIDANFPRLINGLRAAPAGMSTVETITEVPSVITGSPVNSLRTWAQLVKSATRHDTAKSFRTMMTQPFTHPLGVERSFGYDWPYSTVWERMVALYGWPTRGVR